MYYAKKILFVVWLCLGFTTLTVAQDLSTLKNVDVTSLSDDEISNYWNAIQKNGYTMGQVEKMAQVQGISPTKVAEFKRRVASLSAITQKEEKIVQAKTVAEKVSEPYGVENGQVVQNKSTGLQLFGYSFFEHSKISFNPSTNIAVPDTYQVGPGDEMMIDLWGATETTYTATVNNKGFIKINGLGFIYINGFSLAKASKKIIQKLTQKHAGITAPKDSFSKIYTNVTVSKIRTVQVNIIGEVKAPGTYALNSLSTVLNALYVAGGPTKLGTFRAIKLVRANKVVGTLDIYEYLLNGTQKGNSTLQDQDVLLVGPYQNLITVEGAVKRPGIYEVAATETLADLIGYFGGFTPKAYTELFVVERLNGLEREVKEVVLADAANFKLQPGDKILVQEVLDTYTNKVSIEGEVLRPGSFEFTAGMSLADLFEKAKGITPETFVSRGLILRTNADASKEQIPFDVTKILQGTQQIALQNKDVVTVFSKESLREKRVVQINGAVNTPGTLPFVENMQIEDAIALSGGLQERADPKQVSISRLLKDGSYTTLSKTFTISSEENLALNDGVPFYIEPFDQITVRSLVGYTTQQNVRISGQVLYPGTYSIESKNERISDLVQRAGDVTEYAYLEGARLARLVNKDNTIKNIGIDLIEILKKPGSSIDLYLKPGDELVIPEVKETVQVAGEVLVPSLVQYQKNKNLKYYISNSGGFTDAAKKSNTYVRYSNGEIKTVKKFLFFKFYPKVTQGADIFVPTRQKKERLSTQEVLGITSSIATLALIIQSLTN
ncbi:SLBB domain-containing protein [Polaribacter sp.]|uniref:SLBB domain-containing protein n=1 Tax=Polaribacter sp. TaxID=1920175 RepID=UPI003F69F20B